MLKSKVVGAAATIRANVTRYSLMAVALFAAILSAAMPAHADTTPTYGMGQGGSPAASDYLSAAGGFNSSLAPLLTAILPVLVVILAIWKGPWLLKKLVSGFTH